LTFVYPCIASIIVNDEQQDATILAYIFFPNQLYMLCSFGRFAQTCITDGQSDIYQMSYWYNLFSWWWARGCSKHV